MRPTWGVLELVDESARLRDSIGGELVADQRIAERWTIRRGEILHDSRKDLVATP
ncbi:MAG: hypothetical protein ACE5JU_25635 [Candidatus Binatia bacterium]